MTLLKAFKTPFNAPPAFGKSDSRQHADETAYTEAVINVDKATPKGKTGKDRKSKQPLNNKTAKNHHSDVQSARPIDFQINNFHFLSK